MQLFRPTGLRELQLVFQLGLRAWPPRLPEQPIFYPVLNVGYAEQIARDWNTKSDARVGYVTEFAIDDAYASRFERKVVGAGHHEELWVPAEDLDEFNAHIVSPIRVLSAFFGDGFTGLIPSAGGLRGRTATQQLEILAGQLACSFQDFHGEVTQSPEAIFLHLPFWAAMDMEPLRLPVSRSTVLAAVEQVWSGAFPTLPLPTRAG
jgi:hypothetical protein